MRPLLAFLEAAERQDYCLRRRTGDSKASPPSVALLPVSPSPDRPFLLTIYRSALLRGSSTSNRGQAARSASNSHRGLLPRHLGNSAGGTGKVNNSSIDQRWSVKPAAIAGVRSSPRVRCAHTKL